MDFVSVFDIFKIGVGPSSSHTLGPWKAALHFRDKIKHEEIEFICVELYGSLSKTGKGHGTDIAILLGLSGYDPVTINTSLIDSIVEDIKTKGYLVVHSKVIQFEYKSTFIFNSEALSYHPNGMTLKAEIKNGEVISQTYYSVGGGFLELENETHSKLETHHNVIPYPIDKESDLLKHINASGLPIWQIVLANELALNNNLVINEKVMDIWDTMLDCMYKGSHTKGELPGGLNVKRRAEEINKKLTLGNDSQNVEEWIRNIKKTPGNFENVNQWISCFALAVNEENAAFGRIVTSPTNGAAGIIPAVFMYHYCFGNYESDEELIRFFLTASEIGSLFKKGATISAAAGGCQAEVGVSASMAAAGLTELKGGSPEQVLMSAEIAMEHHLGLTCDPVGGLVQIPCIERNAIGAMKAIAASNLALNSDPQKAKVKLDDVIKTMWQTAKDMNLKYRETSEGGLAVNISNQVLPNC